MRLQRLLSQLFPCPYLLGAQTVFIVVVGCYAVGAEGSIAIALPAAAQVDGFVDASEFILATDGDAYGIVFAIAYVGETYFADDGRVEGSWGTEAIDA